MDKLIAEIIKKNPYNQPLKKQLLALDAEIDEILQDRNRLITELSRARNTINQLRAGIEDCKM